MVVGALIGASPAVATVSVYPPGGATWRRDGVLALYGLREPMLGSDPGPTRYAVAVWQELLAEIGYDVPRSARYDADTAAAVGRYQRRAGLPATGAINFPTARALLGPTIRREAVRAGMPVGLLCGHLAAESYLDPQAVGANGVDLGLAQISVPYHPQFSEAEFFDEDTAIRYMAERDAKAYGTFGDWSIAVASYNNPARARAWARTGRPDDVARVYAERAQRGCAPLGGTATVTTERTLWRFAVTQLGDGLRWREIADLNSLRRTSELKAGQVLSLPTP